MNDKKTYRRSTEDSRTAKAAAEAVAKKLREELQETLAGIIDAHFENVTERLDKLSERVDSLKEAVDAKLEDLEGWDADGFAAQLDDIEDTLKEPILKACLRGAA